MLNYTLDFFPIRMSAQHHLSLVGYKHSRKIKVGREEIKKKRAAYHKTDNSNLKSD